VLLSLGLVIGLIGHFPQGVASQPAPSATEVRGVWLTTVDSNVLFSRDRLSSAIARLAKLNFNTIYSTVWNRGYTLYPSTVAERTMGQAMDSNPGLQGRDILAELVEQGHKQGLSVVPWLDFGFKVAADSGVVHRHPEWITYRRDARSVVKGDQHNRVWLNPFHPMVQRFMVGLIAEVVSKYDVDGIQIDDHFGLPIDLGYDTYTAQLYQRENRGRRPPWNPRDPAWMRWRANKITELMTQIHQEVKSRKPNCLVTLAPNSQDYAYQTSLQDWRTWEKRGLMDEIVLQVYRDDLKTFVKELDRPEVKTTLSRLPVSIGILAGLKNRPVSMKLIQQQVQAVRKRPFAGMSFFFYESLGDRDSEFQALFPSPVGLPSLEQRSVQSNQIVQ
jgi:uncharacterized lipoprotein YddW (UPF0748 family)